GRPGMGGMPSAQMTCCGLIGLGLAYGAVDKPGKRNMAKDPAIVAALRAIAQVIQFPKSSLGDVRQIDTHNKLYEKLFYTLWTIERMAVLYDFETIEGKDWYKWGAQVLVVNQHADGSWQGEFKEGGADTCFSLLFLKRANLTSDLTERIKKDPYRPKQP